MKKKWFFENLREEALKYKNKRDFRKGNPQACKAACIREDYALIVSHMPEKLDQSGINNPLLKWTFEKLREEALKYKTRRDFRLGNSAAAQAARKREDYELIVEHMPPSITEAYTLEELKQIALKYKHKVDFQRKDSGAYQVAKNRPDFEEICSHMARLKKAIYSDEDIINEALKYDERTKFGRGSPSVYSASLDRGEEFHNRICSHMKRPKMSDPEKTILEAVSKYFPEAKKFVARNLNIAGKSYITRLEVDILVKSLGKAIEYDSNRFHSIEGLKRGHPIWPMDGIEQYHEIKDSAFLALGIEILHIKEDEWKEDKQACIKKCLTFLGLDDLSVELLGFNKTAA